MLELNDENGKPKVDNLNPDESLQSRPRMGMVIMYDFTYDEDNVWEDGETMIPRGNTYSGTITLTSQNNLDLRGYVGLPCLVEQATGQEKWTNISPFYTS